MQNIDELKASKDDLTTDEDQDEFCKQAVHCCNDE